MISKFTETKPLGLAHLRYLGIGTQEWLFFSCFQLIFHLKDSVQAIC